MKTSAWCVAGLLVAALLGGNPGAQTPADAMKADAEGERWVAATLKKMTLDDKVGQLLVSSFGSEYLSTDSREYDALVRSIHEYKIGGFHAVSYTHLRAHETRHDL